MQSRKRGVMNLIDARNDLDRLILEQHIEEENFRMLNADISMIESDVYELEASIREKKEELQNVQYRKNKIQLKVFESFERYSKIIKGEVCL